MGICCNPHSVHRPYAKDIEKTLREAFAQASSHAKSPMVIFIDEIDVLCNRQNSRFVLNKVLIIQSFFFVILLWFIVRWLRFYVVLTATGWICAFSFSGGKQYPKGIRSKGEKLCVRIHLLSDLLMLGRALFGCSFIVYSCTSLGLQFVSSFVSWNYCSNFVYDW